MTLRLFNKSAILTIQKTRGFFGTTTDNQIRITNQRIVAKVQKTKQSQPNVGTITIYNLSDQTRAALAEKPLMVTLEAGYDGVMSRVFVGNIKRVLSNARPPDVETVLTLGDGERAYRHARVSRSFGSGASYKDVVRELAGSMGLRIPANVDQGLEFARTIPTGQVVEGLSSLQMTKVVGALGKSWSIQDGQLQILGPDEARPDQAILIQSPPEGDMIGSPENTEPKEEGGSPKIMVTTLLRTDVSPGRKIQIKSRRTNGVFVVENVSHDLDTHGQAWTTSIEAKVLK